MSVALFLMSFIAACLGAAILFAAKTSIHEIQAGLCFLIASVFFSGSGIVYAIDHLRQSIVKTNPPVPAAATEPNAKIYALGLVQEPTSMEWIATGYAKGMGTLQARGKTRREAEEALQALAAQRVAEEGEDTGR